MKKIITAVCVLGAMAGAVAQQGNQLQNQSTEPARTTPAHTRPMPQGNGYRVYMNSDSVFIADKDKQLVYRCALSDTSYLAVVRGLRQTGKLNLPKR